MAFLECHYQSAVLGKTCSMNVIIPQAPRSPKCPPYPVVYLLHGLSDDSSMWMRYSSIERYAADYDVVIVMPDAQRSFYTDAVDGFPFWTMISEELPQLVQNMFPVSKKREDTFAAGLSMGGYGALKLALRHPDRYAGAVGMSSVADIKHWCRTNPGREFERIYGKNPDFANNDEDLFPLAAKVAAMPNPPKIMTVCGTEDFLYEPNQEFRKHMEALKYPGYKYMEGPGVHNWAFWDEWVKTALSFFLADR